MGCMHTVARRDSLAYKVFLLAATARDIWLNNRYIDRYIGDFSATVQKYYTGISLKRYLFLVFVELPLIYLTSALTWAVLPLTIAYPFYRAGQHWHEFQFSVFQAPLLTAALAMLTFIVVGGICFLALRWAESEPPKISRRIKSWLISVPDEDIEKYPGPVHLLKKCIAGSKERRAKQITWDRGGRIR
ncbi:MAG: hypothetical protein GF409_04040 [Candidatus Omnitrophica bacterium]|nr:hypothetical protein [Candidatus Omnitrophota bacterium]